MTPHSNIRFVRAAFARIILVQDDRAWSGAEWVDYDREFGLPKLVQICNFANEQQARAYVASHPLLASSKKS